MLAVISPSYMRPLFHKSSGHVLLVLALVMVTLGSVIIGKIVELKA